MNKIIVLMIVICLIYASFLPTQNQEIYEEYNFDTEVISVDELIYTSLEDNAIAKLHYLRAPKDIREIISNLFVILKVELYESEKVWTDMTSSLGDKYKYSFIVKETYKGKFSNSKIELEANNIFAFHNVGLERTSIFSIGEEYILFVKKEISIIRGDEYDMDTLFFCVENENIVAQYQHGKTYTDNLFLTIDDFKLFLEMNTRNTKDNGKAHGCDYIETDDIKKIVNFSEVIVKANLEEIFFSNEESGVSSVKISLVDVYKGEASKLGNLTLFNNDVRIGEEAIILLSKEQYSNSEGYEYCISSYDSIIYEDDARYDEYLAYIALEKFINKDHLVEMDIPAYLTCDVKDYNKCSAIKNASGDCYLDILYSWEFIWEKAQGDASLVLIIIKTI